MRPELKSEVSRCYGEKVSTFGVTPGGVGWKDEHSQAMWITKRITFIMATPYFSSISARVIFAKYVTLIYDYELYEWTVLIKKEI